MKLGLDVCVSWTGLQREREREIERDVFTVCRKMALKAEVTDYHNAMTWVKLGFRTCVGLELRVTRCYKGMTGVKLQCACLQDVGVLDCRQL